jgi:hypothetical protein
VREKFAKKGFRGAMFCKTSVARRAWADFRQALKIKGFFRPGHLSPTLRAYLKNGPMSKIIELFKLA